MAETAVAAPPRSRRNTRRWALRIIGVTGTVILVAYLIISLVIATSLTVPKRRQVEMTANGWSYTVNPASVGLQYEEVRFPARGDDTEIGGWFIPSAERARAIIFVHGKDGCRSCEYQNRSLQLAKALQAQGLSMLMIDMRGHGASDDGHFTFGLRERRDIQGAVDWLLKQGFQPGRIGVLGVSMGAASSIGATADEPAIGALFADSPYADIYPLLRQEFPNASGLPLIFLPSGLFMARFVTGENIAASRPIDEIGRIAPRPILITHSTGDRLIPVSDAERLAAAASNVDLWITPGDGHVRSYSLDPGAYAARVVQFFNSNLR